MRSKLLLFTAVCLFSVTLSAQTVLEYVTDVVERPPAVSFNGRVLLTGNDLTYLEAFSDDYGIQRYNYPLVDGERLRYRSLRYASVYYGVIEPPAIYNSQAYLVLWKGTTPFLYQFNGNTFNLVSIPGTIVSRPVAFGTKLYILSQSGATIQLYSYNGSTVSAVSSGTIPATNSYDLIVAGSYLYLVGAAVHVGEPYTVKRYDGTVFFTLPSFDFRGTITNIYAVGTNAYFMAGSSIIHYFNGTLLTTVFGGPGIIYAALWDDNLYVLAIEGFGPSEVPLYRLSAGTLSAIAMPAGTKIFTYPDFAVYNDAIYMMATHTATGDKVLRYDGTGFTDFFIVPGGIRPNERIFTRENNLVIHPGEHATSSVYEYDGTSFTEIRVPASPYSHYIARSLPGTACNYLWYSTYFDESPGYIDHRNILLKESRGCPVPAIPEHFFEFEKVDVNFWGKDRGWCWSEIIIDWVINPCDFPEPCPEPGYLVSMYDKNNKMAWQKTVEKPSLLSVPIKDDQPYSTRIKTLTGQQEDLFVLADNLVEKGIESISLSMKPGDDFFKITATTDKGMQVPFRVELLGKNGQVLWSTDFTAPFSKQISDKVQQPGQTLRFSIPGTELKSIITNLNIYPNPSKGQIYLQVKSDSRLTDAELSIFSLLGQRIMNRKIKIPFSEQLKLTDTRPGMYVLKLKTAEGEMSRIIKLE
jgi:hypothetical protein